MGIICGQLHNRLHELNTVTKFMTFKTRLCFVKSFVIGKLQYVLPLYFGIDTNLQNKFHHVIMKSAHTIIGNYCFKKGINYILNKCGLLGIKEFIIFSSMKFLYSLSMSQEPNSIITLFQKQNARSKQFKFRPLYDPKTNIIKKTCFHEGARVFNELPSVLKSGSKATFAKHLKGYINDNGLWDVCIGE